MRLIPTRQQWHDWTLPSKLSAIGAYVGIVALVAALGFYAFRGSQLPSLVHTTQINTRSSGPFSPAITSTGPNSDVSVTYSFKSDDLAKDVPRYELYCQKMKSPPESAIPEEVYEMGFKNITDSPLLNFEFAIYFKEPVESVKYDFNRSSANLTRGKYLSPDKKRYHWRGNQIMEDGGWVVFIIRTKTPPPIITRICAKIPGILIPDKKLIAPDPDGIPRS